MPSTQQRLDVIYEPRGKAREYAELACNLFNGCEHQCSYCYGADVTKQTQEAFNSPRVRSRILQRLQKDARALAGDPRPVQLCFVTDPYQSFDVQTGTTRKAIEILHANRLNVSILTKGGDRAQRDFDLLTPKDKFGVTLTRLHQHHSVEEEPNAAPPGQRRESLLRAHQLGIPTWVSLEPVIEPADTLAIIRGTHTFVDEYKIGKMNYREGTFPINTFANRLAELLEELGCDYYIKDSLMPYMPEGTPQSRRSN